MRIFIAEDEAPARERLIEAVRRVAPSAEIAGWAASVRDASAWLASHPAPDLMLLDIQLADGPSLELFADGHLASPVIFTTAFDEFVLDAFRAQAIDYLLKPVNEGQLAQAFAKRGRLERHFAGQPRVSSPVCWRSGRRRRGAASSAARARTSPRCRSSRWRIS